MEYLNDTMRVEMALPVHMMLAVLLVGTNCSEPAPLRHNPTIAEVNAKATEWEAYQKRIDTDPEFARAVQIYRTTKKYLIEAADEPLKGVYPERKALSLLRRVERIHREIVAPYVHGEDADPRKIGIIAYYLIQHLIDTETLIIPPDSAFGKALDIILPALSPLDDATEKDLEEFERLTRSARKQARKVLLKLKQVGYYQDIPLPHYQEYEPV